MLLKCSDFLLQCLTESEANNRSAVLKRLSPPRVDPAVLKSPRHTKRDPASGRFAKNLPCSLMPGVSPPELETSERQRRPSSVKSITPSRQEGFGTPQELSKNLDETTIPDSSGQSIPEHRRKLEDVPDLSKFLKSPCRKKNVYDFASDSSPKPQFTSIVMRHRSSEIERKESSRNTSSESVNQRSARFIFNKTYSRDRTNVDEKQSTMADDAVQAGECSGVNRRLAASPRKVIASPASSNSPENVAVVGWKKSKSEGEDTARLRRSARILQLMKRTPTKET